MNMNAFQNSLLTIHLEKQIDWSLGVMERSLCRVENRTDRKVQTLMLMLLLFLLLLMKMNNKSLIPLN
jgi:hypothetical protein